MTVWLSDPLDFALSSAREASGPPEARGLARDEVRLLVARPRRSRTPASATWPVTCDRVTWSW